MQVLLFPMVNSVLYPSTSKPLNIFEPRYVQMMKDAAEQKLPVAIGFIEDPEAQPEVAAGERINFVRTVAGYGEVIIFEEREDKSLLVFIQGKGKVRLGTLMVSQQPYFTVQAEVINEVHEVSPQHIDKLKTLHKVLVKWIESHLPDERQQQQIINSLQLPEEIVGCFASYLIADYDFQQMVLEEDNINQKIDLIYRLVESGELI